MAVSTRGAGLQYAITNLGDFGAPYYEAISSANAINSQSQITGFATTTNGSIHAFYYDGQMHDLGLPDQAGESRGYGINNNGVIVGYSDKGAFYNADHTTNGNVLIPALGGSSRGNTAWAINDQGVIVGNSYVGTSQNVNAFLYQYPGGTLEDLGDLEGSDNTSYYSGALAINNSGVIVGEGQDTTSGGVYHAFIYSGGMMTGLPLLPGDSGSDAYAINSANVAVGQTGNNDGVGQAHAVFWNGGSVTALASGSVSTASGINNSGQIVGWVYTNSAQHAFVYVNGTMLDMNTLIAPGQTGGFNTLTAANAINDSGVIVGYGYTTNGIYESAFIATPTSATVASPVIVLNQPVLANQQVLLNFTVTNLINATYHLLQAAQLNAAGWTTESDAVLTTNLINSSYRFTVTNNSNQQFYRVQSP